MNLRQRKSIKTYRAGHPRVWRGYEPPGRVLPYGGRKREVSRWQLWTGGALGILAALGVMWVLLDALYQGGVGK